MDLRRKYASFALEQEPFTRRAENEERPFDWHYLEVDEDSLIKIQEKTFHPEDHYPKPPEGLPTGHPVLLAWKKLMSAKEDLDTGVDIIKKHHGHVHDKVEAVLQDKPLEEKLKGYRVDHVKNEKDFFQKALAYLYIYNACPETQKEPESTELLHQVESVYISHMVYAVVKKTTHIFKPFRENGDLVMDHAYKTCVQVTNSHLARIKRTSSPEEKAFLYERMNIAIIVALCHDYLEDFELTPQYLADQLTSQLKFEPSIKDDMRRTGYPIQADTNPFSRNEDTIMRLLATLTKPAKGMPGRDTYLQDRIIHGETLSEDEKILAMEVKGADRLNNLNTLDAKPLAKQISYLRETLEEIVCTTIDVLKRSPQATQLRANITNLCMTVARLALDLKEQRLPEIQTLGLEIGTNLAITLEFARLAFLEYYSAED